MNAHSSSVADDLTYVGFGPDGFGHVAGSGYDLDDDYGSLAAADLAEYFDDDFDSLDAVERHGLRRMTRSHAQQLLADHVGDLASDLYLDSDAAATVLFWTSDQQPETMRQSLLELLALDEDSPASSWLAAWRGGGISRRELRRAAGGHIEAARVELMLETGTAVVSGPWRRQADCHERVHQLHLLRLAIRHGELELDAAGEQIAEMWEEEVRAELRARLREVQAGSATDDDLFADTTELLAAISEMWRDTAPSGKPLRLPLERLTRVAWVVGQRRSLSRAERAALLIAAANQRLDDLWSGSFEGPLYTGYASGECSDATWIGGRRPKSAGAPDATAEALVLRALSGAARTGPKRIGF